MQDLDLKEVKTKALKERLGELGFGNGKGALFIDGEANESFRQAAANLPGIDVLPSAGANVYDILNHGHARADAGGGPEAGGPVQWLTQQRRRAAGRCHITM